MLKISYLMSHSQGSHISESECENCWDLYHRIVSPFQVPSSWAVHLVSISVSSLFEHSWRGAEFHCLLL